MLKDTDDPLMLVPEDQNDRLELNCLIVDISCDEGMVFSFAKPTHF
jgi:N5-(carboxyethyl)ornithine synthase